MVAFARAIILLESRLDSFVLPVLNKMLKTKNNVKSEGGVCGKSHSLIVISEVFVRLSRAVRVKSRTQPLEASRLRSEKYFISILVLIS